MVEQTMSVEVLYADADRQILRCVEVPVGATARQAVDASGIVGLIPSGAFDETRLGIFSQRVPAQQVLRAGDRVEIYRPLALDPMEARRQRARKD
ncbi:MAG: RnfH family protein [Rhodanobacter sp.]